jgi:hypothetical protein
MNAARENGDPALTDAAWTRDTYHRPGNVIGNVIGTFLRSDAYAGLVSRVGIDVASLGSTPLNGSGVDN